MKIKAKSLYKTQSLSVPVAVQFGRGRFGITLIELLVVIAIIGILTGILLTAVQQVREASRRVQCFNNVRQNALGLLNYESAHRRLPPGITAFNATPYRSRSWLQAILPFVDQNNVFEQSNRDYAASPSPFRGHIGFQTIIPSFQCPSDSASGSLQWSRRGYLVATTTYQGVAGLDHETNDGVLYHESRISLNEISDGQSNTLLIGERPPSPDFWLGWWYTGAGQDGKGSLDMLLGVRERLQPNFADSELTYLLGCSGEVHHFRPPRRKNHCSPLHYWSYHPGGATFAMADGSTHFLPYQADSIIPALATRAEGEAVTLSD